MPFIVTQQVPWQRAIFVTDAQKTAKRHDCIRDLSATLIDHNAFDRIQLISITVANRRASTLSLAIKLVVSRAITSGPTSTS